LASVFGEGDDDADDTTRDFSFCFFLFAGIIRKKRLFYCYFFSNLPYVKKWRKRKSKKNGSFFF